MYRQAGRQAGKQAGRQAGRREGRQAGRQLYTSRSLECPDAEEAAGCLKDHQDKDTVPISNAIVSIAYDKGMLVKDVTRLDPDPEFSLSGYSFQFWRACRQAGRQAGRHAGRQAGRQGMQAGRQASRQTCRPFRHDASTMEDAPPPKRHRISAAVPKDIQAVHYPYPDTLPECLHLPARSRAPFDLARRYRKSS